MPSVADMLICEELLLVATGGDGKPVTAKSRLDLALAGATLCELAACQRVGVKNGRVAVLDSRPGGDPLLDNALAIFARRDGKKPAKVLPEVAKGMTDRTYQRLVDTGAVQHVGGGFLHPSRYPVLDVAARDALVAGGGRVLAETAAPDLHSGSLIAPLAAADAVTKVYDSHSFGLSGRELKKRAKAVGEQDWAAGAAAAAVKSAQDAMTAAMVAVTTATTAGVISG
ncbi:GOLPH3/VPS74 family protein [Flexivirga sp. B27]